MKMKTFYATAALATTVCMAAACGDDQTGEAASQGVGAPSHPSCAPAKIAIVLDKSKSAGRMRTPSVSLDDVEPLIELIATCGGELAVGVIHDKITDPFVRLRLDAQPQKPAESQARNLLRRRDEQDEIDRAFAEEFARWEDETTSRVSVFGERVTALVDHPADANWSPVWDSVARGDLFLAERESGLTSSATRVLLLASDAVDDARGVPAQRRTPIQTLKSGAAVLIVNGAGSAGSLGALDPELFESFDSAIRYIDDLVSVPPTTTHKGSEQ